MTTTLAVLAPTISFALAVVALFFVTSREKEQQSAPKDEPASRSIAGESPVVEAVSADVASPAETRFASPSRPTMKQLTSAGWTLLILLALSFVVSVVAARTAVRTADVARQRAEAAERKAELLAFAGIFEKPVGRVKLRVRVPSVSGTVYRGDSTRATMDVLRRLATRPPGLRIEKDLPVTLTIKYGPGWDATFFAGSTTEATGAISLRGEGGDMQGLSRASASNYAYGGSTVMAFDVANGEPLNAAKWRQFVERNGELIIFTIPLAEKPSPQQVKMYLAAFAKQVVDGEVELRVHDTAGVALVGKLVPSGFEVDVRQLTVTYRVTKLKTDFRADVPKSTRVP